MDNTAESTIESNDKGSWITFFAVKTFEFILLGSILGISFVFQSYEDAFPWPHLVSGIEIGYFIIISVLLLSGFCKVRAHRSMHGLFNFIGFALFVAAGVRIIYYYKIQYELAAESCAKVGFNLNSLTSAAIGLLKNDEGSKAYKSGLSINSTSEEETKKLKKLFMLGFTRGSMDIVEGLILLT
ncbi:GSCOCG00007927001-RA-CDS, partial [Cotesia congregata]